MNLDEAMKRISQLEEALMLMVYQYTSQMTGWSIDTCAPVSMPLPHWALKTETALISWRKC